MLYGVGVLLFTSFQGLPEPLLDFIFVTNPRFLFVNIHLGFE
jgi:hypothetical protein